MLTLTGRLAEAGEEITHLSLEMDSVIEDESRIFQAFLVGPGRQVEMGIDARSTEAGDLDMLAAYSAGGIRDHSGGADNLELAGVDGFAGGGAGGEE